MLLILDLIVQNSMNQLVIDTVKELVEKNLTIYLSEFEVTLKPKHHFMVHYSSLISRVGPLKNIGICHETRTPRIKEID